MWTRTINGWEFIKIQYTSQGLPIVKNKKD
jgi:hypothetical protein